MPETKELITKELIAQIYKFEMLEDVTFEFRNPPPGCISFKTVFTKDCINIYELANRCKEWAQDNQYQVSSYSDFGTHDWFSQITTLDEHRVNRKTFCAQDEARAIFLACEYIRKKINT